MTTADAAGACPLVMRRQGFQTLCNACDFVTQQSMTVTPWRQDWAIVGETVAHYPEEVKGCGGHEICRFRGSLIARLRTFVW
jgi:hypothetical protein